jgi:hypothetical protein
MFAIDAAVLVFGAVFFTIFASGELQPWAAITPTHVDDGGMHTVELTKKNNDSIVTTTNDIHCTRDGKQSQYKFFCHPYKSQTITQS